MTSLVVGCAESLDAPDEVSAVSHLAGVQGSRSVHHTTVSPLLHQLSPYWPVGFSFRLQCVPVWPSVAAVLHQGGASEVGVLSLAVHFQSLFTGREVGYVCSHEEFGQFLLILTACGGGQGCSG